MKQKLFVTVMIIAEKWSPLCDNYALLSVCAGVHNGNYNKCNQCVQVSTMVITISAISDSDPQRLTFNFTDPKCIKNANENEKLYQHLRPE